MSNINGVNLDRINTVHMESMLLKMGYEIEETGPMTPAEMIVAIGEVSRDNYTGDILTCDICGGSSPSDMEACPYCGDGAPIEEAPKKKAVKRVKTNAEAKQVSIDESVETEKEVAPNGQVLKKRGRPAKAKEAVSEEDVKQVEEIAVDAPKKRGRPAKTKEEAPVEEPKTEEAQIEEAPKKRGRPAKIKEVGSEEAHVEEPKIEEAPKKRGRPAKSKEEIVPANEIVISAENDLTVRQTESDLDSVVDDVNNKIRNCVNDYWELGTKLAEVQKTKIWKQRKGADGKPAYSRFEQFLESEIKISRTTAVRLIDVSLNYSKEDMQKYGLTKLALTLQAKAEDRAELQHAIESGASTREIESRVKQPKIAPYQGSPEEVPVHLDRCAPEERERILQEDRKRILAKANPPMTVVMKSMIREKMFSSLPTQRTKIATCIEDGPEVRIQFENDTVGTFRVELNPAGEVVLMVEVRRQTLDRLDQTTAEVIREEISAEDLEADDFDDDNE